MNFGTVLATSRRGWFGNGSLWVELPQGSVLEAIPRRHSRFLETKFGWFRAVAGQVRVVGRPATGPPAPFRSQVGTVPEYGPRGFTPSGLGFGRAGCWQLTGTLAGTSLRIIVSVVPTVLP